jgi:predicted amidohydrolase
LRSCQQPFLISLASRDNRILRSLVSSSRVVFAEGPPVRIALANIRPAGSPDESVQLARAAVQSAADRGAAIVCFPEGYVPGYRTREKPMPPPDEVFLTRAWHDIATTAASSGIAVVLGTERLVDDAPRLTALVIDRDGRTLGFQDKVQLDPSEEWLYRQGVDRQLFTAGGLTFGVVICHEGWRYPETVRWAAQRGAQVVFHPHFHEPVPGGYRPTTFLDPKNTFHEKAMLCRAAENTVWFASVNCAIEGSPSTSAVIDPEGSVLAWQPYGKEGLLIADVAKEIGSGYLASRCRTPVHLE